MSVPEGFCRDCPGKDHCALGGCDRLNHPEARTGDMSLSVVQAGNPSAPVLSCQQTQRETA